MAALAHSSSLLRPVRQPGAEAAPAGPQSACSTLSALPSSMSDRAPVALCHGGRSLAFPVTRKGSPTAAYPRVAAVASPARHVADLPLPPPAPNRLTQLFEKGGQSPWIDNLTRDWAASGHLEELVRRGVRGLTSNPTIFDKAIEGSDIYDEQIIDVIRAQGLGKSATLDEVEGVFWELAKADVTKAAGIMQGLYAESQGGDGFVSLEVSPAMAHDTQATTDMARHLHSSLGHPNLMVKIPATKEGLPAIQQMISEGKNINVTLIFSLTRYAEVVEAYLSGLEALAAANPSSLPSVSSVASFFISRVDGLVDKKLDALGTPEALALRGRVAVAQGVMAYQLFLSKFSGPRWERLAGAGAKVQRPLWASTGVKSKAYKDTLYVDELVAANTVNTMPDSTLVAFADHGKVSQFYDDNVKDAEQVLRSLADIGIDLEDAAQELEADGVKKFADSWDSLLKTLQGKVTSLAPQA